MKDRKLLSSTSSAQLVAYLRQRGHTQAKIARMLGVTEGYVSLVKSRERALTIDHLERIAAALGVPLGALIIAATPKPKKASAEVRTLFEASERILDAIDVARGAILSSRPTKRRRSA